MAALQPAVAGQAVTPTTKKSFSQLFSHLAGSPINLRPATTYKGEEIVVFSKEKGDKLAAPFR